MRVLVLGSGGREHALVYAIARSPLVDAVVCAPGSDGIAHDPRLEGKASVRPLDLADLDAVVALALEQRIDLVVVGPEDPLVAGVADRLSDAGIAVFGPRAAAARLEGSKSFAKDFMRRHRIPTADHQTFSSAEDAERHVDALDGPCVVKADGLAAGKGVFVCDRAGQARAAIGEIMRDRRFGAAGARVVIEQRLEGPEVSYYAICDGERFVALGSAQDFKRALDDDEGENTGGMGAYSPVPLVDPALESQILERIVRPVFEGMRAEGSPYRGVLYVGLMLHEGQARVIEFNVRFGDPETQALVFRLQSDLVPLLHAAALGKLPEAGEIPIEWGEPTVCVALASAGYPRDYAKGVPLPALADVVEQPWEHVFHAGTKRDDGSWVTNGGRVLCATASGPTLEAARERAYDLAGRCAWPGAQLRRDIALAAAKHAVRE